MFCPCRPHPLTLGALERYACQCAYDLLDKPQIDRGIYVLRNVCGEEVMHQWLRDAVMSSIDAPLRRRVMEYLIKHGLMNEDDATILMNLSRYHC